MTQDQEREAFEAWVLKDLLEEPVHTSGTDKQWRAWQARAAIAQQAAPAAVPAELLPTAEHIRELAQEALDQIMEQAQVFASAWSLVGGRFDSGNALTDAEDAKAELRILVRSLADLAAETVRPAAPQPAQADDKWRKLALQFDGQRMAAMAHLCTLLKFPDAHADAVRKFLAASPSEAGVKAAGHVSSIESNSPLMCGLSEWERRGLIALYTHPAPAQAPLTATQARAVVAGMGWDLDQQEMEDMEMLVKSAECACAAAWGVKLAPDSNT